MAKKIEKRVPEESEITADTDSEGDRKRLGCIRQIDGKLACGVLLTATEASDAATEASKHAVHVEVDSDGDDEDIEDEAEDAE